MESASPLWLAIFAVALALAAIIAGVVILRQRNRIAAQADALLHDIEALNDRLWALADSEEHYRSLIEAQGDLIVRRDGTRIVYANEAYAALLGMNAADVSGSDAQPRQLASRPAQALDDGTRVSDERLATPEGERWISWVETAVPMASGKTVLQRVGRDITARIAGEQALVEARARAESASQTKSRILATVSHEFRTPLNGILGMADLLGDTPLNPEQATYVGALRSSGEALLSLVDDILDVAKVEAGMLELNPAPFDPRQLAEMVCELMAPRAQAKGLDIATYLAPDIPARLIGDRDRLRQILLNLVGNAVKFTAQGGVGIRLTKVDAMIEIAVCDTGPGIPEDRQQAIFEEFEQADTSTTRDHGGSGLGLSIVKRLVTLMAGDIQVLSRPGEGAQFVVQLPLPSADDARAPMTPDWRGRHILVVSPGEWSARFLCETIGATGAEAVEAASAEAALAHLRGPSRFDAALIDQALGAQAVQELAQAAQAAGVPERLIMLSPSERHQAGMPRDAGFSGFLIKPVRARSLYERLSLDANPPPVAPVMDGIAAEKTRVAAEPHGPRLTVLVAEDNEINALLATRTLERLGHKAIWARDGREALDAIEASLNGMAERFDLVLLDIRMPMIDGLAVARAVRSIEARMGVKDALPLLAVSANVAAADRLAAKEAGMDDCLAKPLDRGLLLNRLARINPRQTQGLH